MNRSTTEPHSPRAQLLPPLFIISLIVGAAAIAACTTESFESVGYVDGVWYCEDSTDCLLEYQCVANRCVERNLTCSDLDGDSFRSGEGCDVNNDDLDDERNQPLDCNDDPANFPGLDLDEARAAAASANPEAAEVCDFIDNDCDGLPDNDVPPIVCPIDRSGSETPNPAGLGVCAEAASTPVVECFNGQQDPNSCLTGCTNELGEAACLYGPDFVRVEDGGPADGTTEGNPLHCDNLDNDCDGVVDEGCECGDTCIANEFENICQLQADPGVTISAENCPCAGSGTVICPGAGDEPFCADANGDRFPAPGDEGLVEIPGNDVDENCNGDLTD